MPADEFTLEEYKYLVSELTRYKDVIRKVEVLSVSGVAAIFAWLATNKDVTIAAWFIPLILSVFGAYRSFTLSKSVKRQYQYLQKLESELVASSGSLLGWFVYRYKTPGVGMTRSRVVFWAALILITVLVPFLLW